MKNSKVEMTAAGKNYNRWEIQRVAFSRELRLAFTICNSNNDIQ